MSEALKIVLTASATIFGSVVDFLELLPRVGERLLDVRHPRGYARRTALTARRLAAGTR
jgi:hypothetical protein